MYPKSALNSLALLLAAQQCTASSSAHKRHGSHMAMHEKVAKRSATKCKLPSDAGLYKVPGGLNGGFALSPDQECTSGSYCPIACPSGQVMAQWDPDSSYVYPQSMNGGLLCGDDGVASKPFPKKPYCVDGTDTVYIVNKCGSPASFCQTVLPGNEAMLIPTIASAGGKAKLAVPDASYWASTAAHYYINPPGVGSEGCIWGDNTKAVGNWAPYVAGANTVANGDTYVKIGWNPIFQFEGAGLEKTLPSFGLEIKCPNGGCNGLPCSIDPNDGLGAVNSGQAASGAGGSSFCVVTVSKGSTANIVLTSGDQLDVDNQAFYDHVNHIEADLDLYFYYDEHHLNYHVHHHVHHHNYHLHHDFHDYLHHVVNYNHIVNLYCREDHHFLYPHLQSPQDYCLGLPDPPQRQRRCLFGERN
ncbi:Protein adg3 [Ceratocystis platani]|uniref:Protein adg3 n=1 Tax=Ceratocystis fimbriata f. sp. platani TaxID=88771 RepID=A0A0F8CRZ3_CERFI|nr:Protein adg3 [Ceratocystis platani]